MPITTADIADFFGVSDSRIIQLRSQGRLETDDHGSYTGTSITRLATQRGKTKPQIDQFFAKFQVRAVVNPPPAPVLELPADRESTLLIVSEAFNKLREDYTQLNEAYQNATGRVAELDKQLADAKSRIEELTLELDEATKPPKPVYSDAELATLDKTGLFRRAS